MRPTRPAPSWLRPCVDHGTASKWSPIHSVTSKPATSSTATAAAKITTAAAAIAAISLARRQMFAPGRSVDALLAAQLNSFGGTPRLDELIGE